MSKFIVYKNDSNQVVFVDRLAITSFETKFVNKNSYRIYVTIGPKELAIASVTSLEEAHAWIDEQIALIERGPMQSTPAKKVA